MSDLAPKAADWTRRWHCIMDGAEVRTEAALLWPVRRGGQALMLKVMSDTSDEEGAAAMLAALDGRGAVRLIEAEGPALLMERISHQGASLEAMALNGDDEAAARVLCQLALEMHAALRGADLPSLRPLDLRMRDLHGWTSALALWAWDLSSEMLADQSNWTALHGDLHHFNALHDSGRGWLSIDPKGILGPPVYDLANCLLNPFPHADHVFHANRMQRLADVVAGEFGVTAKDVLRWTCLHGCLAAAWEGRDAYWAAGARLAGRLAGLRPPD